MIISKTPLRISFVGGGSDNLINQQNFEGKVLSTTIDKFVYLCVNKKFDNYVRFSYSLTENVNSSYKLKHPIAKNVLQYLINEIKLNNTIKTMFSKKNDTNLFKKMTIMLKSDYEVYFLKIRK
jgi:galactokinase/mevalonate kinase-like predicted kinase